MSLKVEPDLTHAVLTDGELRVCLGKQESLKMGSNVKLSRHYSSKGRLG